MRPIVLISFVFAALSWPAGADQIVLKNGDRITGTILKSDGKTLTIKGDLAGTVTVPFDAVTSMTSGQRLSLTLKDGQLIAGPVETAGDKLEVTTQQAGRITAAKDAVVVIRNPDEQAAHEKEEARMRHPGLLDLWAGHLDAGLAAARGNTRTTTLNFGMNATRATRRDKTNFYMTSLYATNSTTGISVTTANAIRGGIRYDLNVTPRLFAFAFTDLEFDEFQRLDLRFAPGGGFGYSVFKREQSFLNLFGGGSLNREFFSDGSRRSSAEMLAGNELQYRVFGGATTLTQRFSFHPNLSQTGEYRMNFDASASTRLSRWLAWQVSLSDRFLSNPVRGAKKNDVLLTTGVRVTFSR